MSEENWLCNYARFVSDPGNLKNLPDPHEQTMKKHARDRRNPSYSARQIEGAETYDELWNATQKEMLLRGKVYGYYRMYWVRASSSGRAITRTSSIS